MTQKYENHRLDEEELREFYLKEQETAKRSAFLGMLGAGLFAIGGIAGSVSLFVLKYNQWYGITAGVVGAFCIWGFIRNLSWYKTIIEDVIMNQPKNKIKQGNLDND